jgi:hypothetical protein
MTQPGGLESPIVNRRRVRTPIGALGYWLISDWMGQTLTPSHMVT